MSRLLHLPNPMRLDANLIILLGVGYLAVKNGWLKELGIGTGGGGATPSAPAVGGGNVSAPAPPIGGGGSGASCPFVGGRRYVAAYGPGFVVVWGGNTVWGPGPQADAEREYNRLAAAGCASGA